MPTPNGSNRPFFGRAILALTILLTLASGCLEQHQPADVASIYRNAAKTDSPHRRPVIVIPGILGSNLIQKETGRIVWGAFGGEYADPLTPAGARLVALPMGAGPLSHLTDDVIPNGALDRVKVRLLGLPLELNAYHNLLHTLGVGGFRDQQLAEAGAIDYGDKHFTCFQFGYDWRRSNADNAALLSAFIEEKRAFVQREYEREFGPGDYDVKFNIVAHSMGGLLTRYFLRYGAAPLTQSGELPELNWAGAAHINTAILVGTPNAGSVFALKQLIEGTKPAPIVNPYAAAIIGTMPAVYELMPRGRHGVAYLNDARGPIIRNLTDIERWQQHEWGMYDPNETKMLRLLLPNEQNDDNRRLIATEHLKKCLTNAERFWAALDKPAIPPPGLKLYLYAGDAVDTPSSLAVNDKTGRVSILSTAPGDGTVPRYSALMDERQGHPFKATLQSPIQWRHVTFLFEDHIGLTKAASFSDNVLFQLLER